MDMKLNSKSYDAVLTEANDFFKTQGVNILGRGYEEIATNPALFESYVDQLTEGCTANDAAAIAQLMENSNRQILTESSLTGITPVASLSGPVIRKLWPKFALKDAVANEVAKTPRFVVVYTAPYMAKGDEKVYLSRGLTMPSGAPAGRKAMDKNYTRGHVVELDAGAAKVVNFKFINGVDGDMDEHVYIADTPSQMKVQPLDELIFEAYVIGDRLTGAADAAKKYVVWDARFLDRHEADGLGVVSGADLVDGDKAYELVKEIKIGKKLNVYGGQVYDIDNAGAQLVVNFDGANDKATFASIGAKVIISCKGAVSSEYNEESWSLGFDIKRQDVDIPTGQHLNAPLPVEALQDMQALYQIDGTKETVDLMTNVFAQKLDVEILEFLTSELLNRPTNEAFQDGTYGVADDFSLVFDCKPAAGYTHSPKEWREELKTQIDYLAQKIKNETYLSTGTFNLVANPLDVMLLSNVDWNFRGGQAGGIDGVTVDYSIGTFIGANTYKVIASTNVPQGRMYIVFIPNGDTQFTYKLYSYSFNTELGYVDPNRSRVPSVMMTKRYTTHAFMSAIGCVFIENNDGQGYFRQYQEVKNV